MSKSGWKLVLHGFTALLMASLAVTVAYIAWAQTTSALRRKTVVLEMTWKRGSVAYGPNFIYLESPCLSNPDTACFCSYNFTRTRTKEFAYYIESFGKKTVPVKYNVDYDDDGRPHGASLESVGDWPADRFNILERTISSGVRLTRDQSPGVAVHGHLTSPSDCFPKSPK